MSNRVLSLCTCGMLFGNVALCGGRWVRLDVTQYCPRCGRKVETNIGLEDDVDMAARSSVDTNRRERRRLAAIARRSR